MRIGDIDERHFYEIQAVKNNWSLRKLKRQFDSALYHRILLSTDKELLQEKLDEWIKVQEIINIL